jgi:DNA repair protein RadC
MHVVCLDVRHNVLGTDTVSIGTATSSIFHPRELFRLAILLNASAIALVHNHPSGSVVPSAEDSQVTTRLKDCCDLMGIHLIDHVIVGVGGFYSFRENGGLQW